MLEDKYSHQSLVGNFSALHLCQKLALRAQLHMCVRIPQSFLNSRCKSNCRCRKHIKVPFPSCISRSTDSCRCVCIPEEAFRRAAAGSISQVGDSRPADREKDLCPIATMMVDHLPNQTAREGWQVDSGNLAMEAAEDWAVCRIKRFSFRAPIIIII